MNAAIERRPGTAIIFCHAKIPRKQKRIPISKFLISGGDYSKFMQITAKGIY